MPNIREYERRNDGFQVSNAGAGYVAAGGEAKARATATWGDVWEGAIKGGGALYVQFKEKKEVGQGGALMATMLDNLNSTYNQMIKDADLNDGTVSTKFKTDTMEPALEEFVNSFDSEKGREWAINTADRIRGTFNEKTLSVDASRGGLAVKQNITEFGSSASNTLIRNPDMLQFYLDTVDGYVKSVSGPMSLDPANKLSVDALADELKSGFVASALRGEMQEDPQGFIEKMDAGAYNELDKYLDAEKQAAIKASAQTLINARKEDARAAKTEAVKAEKQAADREVVSVVANAIQPDGSFNLDPTYFTKVRDVAMKYPETDREFFNASINMGKAILDDQEKGLKTRDDPRVYEQFAGRAFLSADDPRALTLKEVYQARADRKLSDNSVTMFSNALERKTRDPEYTADMDRFGTWVKGKKGLITNSTDFAPGSPESLSMWGDFQIDMQKRYESGRAKGLSPDELLDPTSKTFIAYDIGRYQIDSKTGLQWTIGRANPEGAPPAIPIKGTGPVATKRVPGETPAAYERRMATEAEIARRDALPPDLARPKAPTLYDFNERFGATE